MPGAFDLVLNEYNARIIEETQRMALIPPEERAAQRDSLLLEVGENVARFLAELIVSLDAKVVVELGTSYGYSTLFLARAAAETGGRVYSYEIDPGKQDYARAQMAKAGLEDCIEWRLGDAVSLLVEQPGPVDFVLIDLWKELYVPCFEMIYPKLAPRGVIVADNMLFPEAHREDACLYRAAVRAKNDLETVTLQIGNGVDVSARRVSI